MKTKLPFALISFVALAAHAATITIEPIVRSVGATRDAVPGRDGGFVFRGESDVQRPAINAAGTTVFRGNSSSSFDANSNTAVGVYVLQSGQPLAVLADTTEDGAGNASFAVPQRSADARFIDFDAPLINDAGNVIFHARYIDPIDGNGSGLYAVNATGDPLSRIVDTTVAVPGAGGPTFSGFTFNLTELEGLTLAALNNNGDIVFRGTFDGTSSHGLYGTNLSVPSIVRLADSSRTVVPTNFPLGNPEGFAEIRPEFALNNTGTVVFHGSIDISTTSNILRAGVFTIPVTGGTPDTVAYEFQPAPGSTTFSGFSDVDIADDDALLFRASVAANTAAGLYTAATTGAPISVIVDSLGGFTVPGDDPAANYQSIFMASMNQDGRLGFPARIDTIPTPNNQGVYLADLTGSSIDLVIDATRTAPGLLAPAKLTNLVGDSGNTTTINADGNLAFAGRGLDESGSGLRGIYFLDACANEITRVADSTTALVDLSGEFSPLGAQKKQLDFYQGGETVAGRYRSLNADNDLVFLAQFNNFDFGIYIARIQTGGGAGQPSITCPLDELALECPADLSPAALGSATASDACTGADLATTFVDTDAPDCGLTGTTTRLWTAEDAGGVQVSCEQTLTVVDTTAPSVNCPLDIAASGGINGAVIDFEVFADDVCDPDVSVDTDVAAGSLVPIGVTPITATATDACGNEASCAFDAIVSCFAVNNAKVGTKDARCKGVALLEVTSMVDGEQMVAVHVPDEGEDDLDNNVTVDDGVNGPESIHTSCSQPIEIGDVFGAYTITDLIKVFDDQPDSHGNKIEFRGTFGSAIPIDLTVDDVTFSIADGSGNDVLFTIPAGSFEMDGKPEKEKFKFKSASGVEPKIDAKIEIGRCRFKFKAKDVQGTTDLVGTTLAFGLTIGANAGVEFVDMEDKSNHLEHKKSSKVECCPSCEGIAYMQVTSDQGVLVFEPEPGDDELNSNTQVDDGVNGAVTIHTSCSQSIDVGDVFGPYTVSELVKIFE